MSWGGEAILDTELYTEFLVPGIVKLLAIIANDDLVDPKPVDDRLPCEVANILLSNLSQGLNFHLLGEVVDGYYQKPHFSFPSREQPNFVDSPLSKGLGSCYRDQFLLGYLGNIEKSLTFVTLLGEERGIFFHRWPIISSQDRFVVHYPTSRVATTYPLMYFSVYIVGFLLG